MAAMVSLARDVESSNSAESSDGGVTANLGMTKLLRLACCHSLAWGSTGMLWNGSGLETVLQGENRFTTFHLDCRESWHLEERWRSLQSTEDTRYNITHSALDPESKLFLYSKSLRVVATPGADASELRPATTDMVQLKSTTPSSARLARRLLSHQVEKRRDGV